MNVLVLGTLIGAVLLALLVWDLHATVFVPRGPAGPLARRLYRLCWRVWHRVVGDRSPGARRRLAWLGPLLIPLTVLLWAGLLLLGFMLLLLPYARNFEVDGAVAFAPWFNALYISAYSVSTLGVGDVTPNGELARLIMVVAAASGFVLITVAVTYLLSVYGSLERMTALAFEIHRFVGRGEAGTPPDVLVTVATTDSADELSGWLSSTATSLSQVVQSDDEFPLLHFFHMPDERALPLALSDLLEVVTLCRTVLCPQTFPALAGGASQCRNRAGSAQLLHRAGPQVPRLAAHGPGRPSHSGTSRRLRVGVGTSERGGSAIATPGRGVDPVRGDPGHLGRRQRPAALPVRLPGLRRRAPG